jgi:hypothetical protein
VTTIARSTDRVPDRTEHVRDTARWLFTLAEHRDRFTTTQKAMFDSALRTLRADLAACGLAVPQNLAHTITLDGTLYCHADAATAPAVGRRAINPAAVHSVACSLCQVQVVPARLVREVTR